MYRLYERFNATMHKGNWREKPRRDSSIYRDAIVSRHPFQPHPVGIRLDLRLMGRRSYCPGRYLLPHLRLMIIDPPLFFYSAFACTRAFCRARIVASQRVTSHRRDRPK